MHWITRFLKYVATWRKHRDTVKQLNRLSDKQLSDIGLSRSQIDEMIWLELDRKDRGTETPEEEFYEQLSLDLEEPSSKKALDLSAYRTFEGG